MAECKYHVRSVQRIGNFNYQVELEKLTNVGWLWWKKWESDITFYRTDDGVYWYEEKTGHRAHYMDPILDAAVRKYKWENNREL
jgi:hypothetical protein